jgi:hypothetical protein
MTATPVQLAMDLYATNRVRPGRWPAEAHQRGYVRMPYTTAGGTKVGTVVPAWVCCRCGGVEVGQFPLGINHGCCTQYVPTCTLLRPSPDSPGRLFGECWMPTHH